MVAPLVVAAAIQLAKMAGPAIGRAVAGQRGGHIASKVVDIAAAITGQDDPDEALRTLRESPELYHQYRLALLDMEQAESDREQADRADARARDVAITQAGRHNLRADILAYSALLLTAGIGAALVWAEVPDGASRDVLFFLAGSLVAVVKDVFQFEFGSSRGSKDKDALLLKDEH